MIAHLLIIQLITFGGIIFVLRMLFSRHLNTALKRLKQLHEENLLQESQLKDELERAKRERIAEIEKGKTEAKRLVAEAVKAAEIRGRNMDSQTKQEAQRIFDDGRQALDKMKKELLEKNETKALELALEMIAYSLTDKIKEGLHHELIAEIIEEIRGVEEDKFFVKEKKIKAVCSHALSEDEKKQVKDILSSKMGFEVELEQEINPQIIGGLVIEIGAFVLDGSIKNKLKTIIPLLGKEQDKY